ncbi:TIGR03086 family metal-binding protein [Micromonospora sp. NBC_01796]|uniref:TIGR03086 family metal-binding protein n=1 Tax=Micromonospora sp. NBC_01796 TaxID=2975987 RepID=UPI002DD7C1F9|nr:TIGR03086 family metal-binding protein [Micromonospora sp. NBC_01796]WSA86722.1 TIGR03086 family metal-binding protein [Micromonospora sp. NBC_01796]
MDLLQTYRRSLDEFTDRVAQVGYDQWALPTPCGDWDVRALVNHVVVEDRWTVPLLAGATIEQVGDQFDGDLLGDDPAGTAQDAAAAAERGASEPGALDRTVHLSFGDTPASEYLHQLLAEHLVHGWDLAVAIGVEPKLDAEAVRECARWFTERTGMYRQGGLVASAVHVPENASEQDRLVAAFGRDPDWAPGD